MFVSCNFKHTPPPQQYQGVHYFQNMTFFLSNEKVSKPVNCKYYFKGSHTRDEVKDHLLEGTQSYTQNPFFSFTFVSLSLTLLNSPKMNTHQVDKAVEFINI